MKAVRVGTFLGRPPSICSEVPMQPKIPISLQHQSDILIEKQKENVQHTEDELERILNEIKRASNDSEADFLRRKLAHLKKTCDQMKIILQLVLKLNAELSYARLELKNAFKDQGNVNLERKRVVRLEDWIKKILETHWQSEGISLADCASVESCNPVKVQEFKLYLSDSTRRGDTGKSEESAVHGKCTPRSRISSSQRLSDIKPTSVIHHHSLTNVPKVEGDTALCSCMPSKDKTNEKDGSVVQPSLNSDGNSEENNSPCSEDDREKSNVETSETKSETFITEVLPHHEQQNSAKQSASVKGEQHENCDLLKPNQFTDYWKSEHHRFESSILKDVDATSYHQIALAVQGIFVTDVVKAKSDLKQRPIDRQTDRQTLQDCFMSLVCTSPELPWRQRRKSSTDNASEVQTKELNALSRAVNNMFTEVKKGALISVSKGGHGNSDRKNTNLADANRRVNSSSSFANLPSSIYSKGLPESSNALPAIPNISRKTKKLNVKSLPVARVNPSKVYPRSSNQFSQSVPGLATPAVRIVDQRNLLEETKFSSTLFRSKRGQHIRPVSVESRFRQMIAEDTSPKSSAAWNSSCYLSRGLSKDITMTNQQCDDLTKSQLARIEEIMCINLKSSIDHERADAARSLGLLSHAESRVIEALHMTMKTDSVERVIYEATRSLSLLGSWDEDVQEQLAVYLCTGNQQIKADLLKCMITGSKETSSLDKQQVMFLKLTEVLCELCQNDDLSDLVSFRAAICLAYLDVVKEEAARKLRDVINLSGDPHTKAQALSALILFNKELNEDIVDVTLNQLKCSSVWKYRKDAARHLTEMGLKYKLSSGINDKVYECLKTALWNDVNSMVRTEAGKALTACGLIQKTCEELHQQLEDPSDAVRTQAVISVGTLGMKSERMLKILLNLVQLDPSHKVQQMVIRTFVILHYQDERVLNILKHKATMEGLVAREAQKALEVLSKVAAS